MKKTLTVISLVMVIVISIAAGTLAMYTTTIEGLAAGSVTAKEFILTKGGTDTFQTNVKIAPSETVQWSFSVKNFNEDVVSETAMDLDVAVELKAAEGKSAILPLTVGVYDEGNELLASGEIEDGILTFKDSFPLSETGQTHTYTVKVNWPSDDAVDINYAGADYGTALKVSVTGTQK